MKIRPSFSGIILIYLLKNIKTRIHSSHIFENKFLSLNQLELPSIHPSIHPEIYFFITNYLSTFKYVTILSSSIIFTITAYLTGLTIFNI